MLYKKLYTITAGKGELSHMLSDKKENVEDVSEKQNNDEILHEKVKTA